MFVLWTTLVWSATFVGVGIVGDRIAANYGQEIYWWWLMITVWIWILSVVYFTRFMHGRWRDMQVIEHESALSRRGRD